MTKDDDSPPGAGTPKRVFSVTEINVQVKRLVEGSENLSDIWIEGEISNYKRPDKGNLFFSLKDQSSSLSCIMFRSEMDSLEFSLEDGLKVLVRGRIGVYLPRGIYQFTVQDMVPAGKGALFLSFEQLKKRLSSEGLFSEEYKSDIPLFPKSIGVVTSPTGSAIRDILRVLNERYPMVRVLISPAQVQGEEAAGSLVLALKRLMRLGGTDVIILGRGGGSFEDLWPFNDERLAYTIFKCSIPIVTGIGHETDLSIADLVADASAPTPTAAATMVVQDRKELLGEVVTRRDRLLRAMGSTLDSQDVRLSQLMDRPCLRYPLRLLEEPMQRVDELFDRLGRGVEDNHRQAVHTLAESKASLLANDPTNTVLRYQMGLNGLRQRLTLKCQRQLDIMEKGLDSRRMSLDLHDPRKTIDEHQKLLTERVSNLHHYIHYHFRTQERELASLGKRLDALSPLRHLDRGYAIMRRQPDSQVITSVRHVHVDDDVQVLLRDGEIDCTVNEIKEVRSWERKRT